MPPALRLLVWLRTVALMRALRRFLSTIRGKLVAGGSLFLLIVFVAPVFLDSFSVSTSVSVFDTGSLRKQTTLALFLMFFFVFIKSKKSGVMFSPEEVEHLFTAPFTRNQLLVFKLFTALSQVAASSLIFTLAYGRFTPNYLNAAVGIFLGFTFQSYAVIGFDLFTQVSVRIASRNLRVLIAVILLLVLLTTPFLGSISNDTPFAVPDSFEQFTNQVADSSVGRVVLAPLSVYTNIIFSNGTFVPIWVWVAIAVFQIGLLVMVILWLDVNFLELNATESQNFQKKVNDAKRLGLVVSRKQYQRSIPLLPFWNGLGPVVWRQLLEAYRYFVNLLPAVAIIVLVTCGFAFFNGGDSFSIDFQDERISDTIGFVAGITAGMTTLVFVLLAPVGFRSDIERMDILKSLPLSNSVVVIGQLLGASLILTVIQSLICLIFVCLTQQWIWLFAILGTLPSNYLLFAISGMIILWYPTKPSDEGLAALGGNVITTASMYFAMIIIAMLVGIPVGVLYAFTESIAASVAVVILLGLFWCAIVTSLTVSAYKNFDVSLDTPT